jgi:rare lipoprotein A
MTRYAIPATEDGKRLMLRAGLLSLVAASLAACASAPKPQLGAGGEPTSRYAGYKVGKPYQVKGVWYYPKDQPTYDEIGIASWYGEQFHNHYTADGEIFDMGMPSAV